MNCLIFKLKINFGAKIISARLAHQNVAKLLPINWQLKSYQIPLQRLEATCWFSNLPTDNVASLVVGTKTFICLKLEVRRRQEIVAECLCKSRALARCLTRGYDFYVDELPTRCAFARAKTFISTPSPTISISIKYCLQVHSSRHSLSWMHKSI